MCLSRFDHLLLLLIHKWAHFLVFIVELEKYEEYEPSIEPGLLISTLYIVQMLYILYNM